jgi:hypothetical protein
LRPIRPKPEIAILTAMVVLLGSGDGE